MATSSRHLWAPTPDSISRSNIGRFIEWLRGRGIGPFDSYDALRRWSVDDIAGFWAAVWDFFDVQASVPYTEMLDSTTMPGTKWLIGARLNYAEHILRHAGDSPAIIAHSQTRRPSSMTWNELGDQVGRARAGLQALGIGTGDRVAAYLPNMPETIVAFLATASLGAVWTSCAPEFGVQAVLDRFGQIDPKVLLVVDGYRYGSRDIDRRQEVQAIRDRSGRPAGDGGIAVSRRRGLARDDLVERPRQQSGPGSIRAGRRRSSPVRVCTRRARPACPSQSFTATAESSSSTSRSWACTPTSGRPIGSSGSRRPAG